MRVYAVSDVGSVRDINEDSYYAPSKGERFCCVADGMGGHQAGEVASGIAVETFARMMGDTALPVPERLRAAVVQANTDIYEKARANESMSGMGTTITALAMEGDTAHIAHVGDSRTYLFRNKALMKVTTDHTLVGEMVLQGIITLSEARVHPKRNIITRALGTAETVDIDRIRIHVMPGDMFLICSDGLYGGVSENEIADILNSRMHVEEMPSALLSRALEAGGRDNVTVMIVCPEVDEA